MANFDLEKKYDRTEFISFIQNDFLPDDFINEEEEIDLFFNPQKLKKVTKLGDCSSLDLQVFEIIHESQSDPRVTITKDIFRLMKENSVYNALVILTSHNQANYRLSFVTIGIKESEAKLDYEYSNPRRYSYFLGPSAKVKTPDIYLKNKGKVIDFKDLKSRFSIEVVNKEFYRSIASLFTKLVGGKRKEGSKTNEYEPLLRLPSITDHQKMQEFTVRMIGRIVFCWFLQKKKTPDGESLIHEQILSSGAIEKHPNYYHSILEKLFFQVLNTPINARRSEFESGPFANIPFLNGGLFEPHSDDKYELNENSGTSKADNFLIVPDDWLIKLFKLLETYNFTIDENTSVDIELSVDPEMLGRIFENLLAEINPQTGETARKSTGSYYTPRPIVEYMADESLKQYLKTKTEIDEEKLQLLLSFSEDEENLLEKDRLSTKDKYKILNALYEVKIIDPACGSGAFPMGILQKMVLILQKVDPEALNWTMKHVERIQDPIKKKEEEEKLMKEEWDYVRKLGIIQNSIYGIDIQEIAVEISKLRVFLSLIVDSTIDLKDENLGVKPLPNLEFKFVCANSLIGLPDSQKDDNVGLFEDKSNIKILKKLRDEYFDSFGSGKEKIKEEFLKTQNEMFSTGIKNNALDEQTRLLSSWKPFSNESSNWFDKEWMFGIKKGFDIVIANPPYVQLQKNSGYLANLFKNENYKSFSRMGDIYCLFYEQGFNLLNNSGILTFITSNKWMRAGYGEKLRDFMAKNSDPLKLLDFGGFKVFEATVDTNILISSNKQNNNNLNSCSMKNDFSINTPIHQYFINKKVETKNLSKDSWIILSKEEQKIKEKIEKIGTPLKDWDISINYGIKTGLNEAFIIDGIKKAELIEKDPKSAEIIKPILRGRDIKKYKAKFADLWLINSHNGYKDVPAVNINDYLVIKEHLDQYWDKLKKRDDKGITPYNLRSCAYLEEFEKEKIVFQEMVHEASFAFDKYNKFCNDTGRIITGKNIKYLSCTFNSNLFFYSIKMFYGGGALGKKGIRMKHTFFEKMSIPKISKDKQKPFEILVDKIIKEKENNPNADTTTLEEEIDNMVYKLYGLTKEEIKIIEGK